MAFIVAQDVGGHEWTGGAEGRIADNRHLFYTGHSLGDPVSVDTYWAHLWSPSYSPFDVERNDYALYGSVETEGSGSHTSFDACDQPTIHGTVYGWGGSASSTAYAYTYFDSSQATRYNVKPGEFEMSSELFVSAWAHLVVREDDNDDTWTMKSERVVKTYASGYTYDYIVFSPSRSIERKTVTAEGFALADPMEMWERDPKYHSADHGAYGKVWLEGLTTGRLEAIYYDSARELVFPLDPVLKQR